jgi:hypothetical protein
LRPEGKKEINKLLKQGILVKTKYTNWTSPIVVVRKSNGKVRICGDFRKLNQAILEDKYPLPSTEALLASLGSGNKYFAKIDLQSAYHQISIDVKSQELTTIITHYGTFKYTRMPFGIKSAPSAFQRIMNQVLTGLDKVLVYLDDILIAASSKSELEQRIKVVLNRLDDKRIKINRDKSEFCTTKVNWLSYEISAEGIKPAANKADAIQELRAPKTVKEVRQVLGVINYYRKFIENMAIVAKPIYELLKKDSIFVWSKQCNKAFDEIKGMIRKREALALFNTDSSRKVVLKTDACDDGMGAVLEQEQADGSYKPVIYWSSQFRKYEMNYSVGEKEALACVSAMLSFQNYLLGRHFTLLTDHRALVTLMSQITIKRTNARVERWRERLTVFDYDVKHIKGSDNSIADWLSRSAAKVNHKMAPIYEEVVINAVRKVQPHEVTRYENELAGLVRVIKSSGWDKRAISKYKEYHVKLDRLTVEGDLIFFENSRFVPERDKRDQILSEAHKVHQGINRTRKRVENLFWWPGYGNDVIEYIKNCPVCKQSGRTKMAREAPMIPVELPDGPWQKLAVDIKGPIGRGTHKYLLVIQDYYSKWPEVFGLNRTTTKTIINALNKLFRRFGLPEELGSDNGTQFVSKEFKQYLERLGINPRPVPLYNPSQNGLVERFNRVLAEKLDEAELNKWPIEETIEETLFHYRATPHSTTNVSPFEALFGRK